MKKQLLFIALLFISGFTFAQGSITFGQDSVTIMNKLRIMKLQQGALTDSLVGKKVNGNTTRLSMNQLTPTFSNIIGKPSTLSGYGIIDAYPLAGNPSNFITLNSLLTGYILGTNTPLTSSNSILGAFQNLQAQINNRTPVINTATVGLSRSALNNTYPNATLGFMVISPNILLGGATYIKVSGTGASGVWVTISSPPTL